MNSIETIYYNPNEYASFPSLAFNPLDNSLYCIFRIAHTRTYYTHIDTRSKAIIMKRHIDDDGNWTKVNELTHNKSSGIQDASILIYNGIFYITYFIWRNTVPTKPFTKERRFVELDGVYLWTTDDPSKSFSHSDVILYRSSMATSEPIVPYGSHLLIPAYELYNNKDRSILYDITTDEIFTVIGQSDELEFQEPSTCRWYNLLISMLRVPSKTGSKLYVVYAEGAEPYYTGLDGVSPNLITLSNNDLLCTFCRRINNPSIRASFSKDSGLTWGNEIILAQNAGGWDVGYPSTVQLPDGSFITAYYWYTKEDRIRQIECIRWNRDY